MSKVHTFFDRCAELDDLLNDVDNLREALDAGANAADSEVICAAMVACEKIAKEFLKDLAKIDKRFNKDANVTEEEVQNELQSN